MNKKELEEKMYEYLRKFDWELDDETQMSYMAGAMMMAEVAFNAGRKREFRQGFESSGGVVKYSGSYPKYDSVDDFLEELKK